jgi:diguanylate cyclase (GGDEF)-like protein
VLDTVTLRVAFGLTALCVLVLFYGATYRSTRSPFSLWWIRSLACYLLGAGLFLLNGTAAQGVANPAGNMMGVAGSACVWAAAASLGERRLPRAWLLVPPALVLLLSALDDPAHDVWAGGPFFLAGMWAYFGLGTRELWRLWRERPRSAREDSGYDVALLSMTVSSALLTVFYAVRWLLFLAVGPQAPAFRQLVGAQVTTLLLMVLLVTVTFNMSALAHSQLTRELQAAAEHDALTGLLNRRAFRRRVADLVAAAPPAAPLGFVVMSDFDDFKLLNDHYGHPTGDAVLAAFGAACRAVLRPGELAARLGGDEFSLYVGPGSERSPEQVLDGINERLAVGAARGAHPLPGVSFGVAELAAHEGLDAALARADVALYRAKRSGFGNIVRAE